jgi:hypothetical protein
MDRSFLLPAPTLLLVSAPLVALRRGVLAMRIASSECVQITRDAIASSLSNGFAREAHRDAHSRASRCVEAAMKRGETRPSRALTWP